MSEGELARLIFRLTDAAVSPDAWASALTALGDSFGGSACGFTINDPARRHTEVSVSTRLDPGDIERYNQHFHKIDLFTLNGITTARAGTPVFASHQWIEDAVMESSEFYNDFLAPQDIFFNLGAVVSGPDPVGTFITFLRSRQKGPFSAEECLVLQRLIPHLRNAVHLHRLLRTAQITNSWRESLHEGIVVVSASGILLEMNQTALRLTSANDGVRITSRGLLEFSRARQGGSRRCVTSADWATGQCPEEYSALLADRPSGLQPYVVRRIPVRDSFARTVSAARASAIFEILDPEKPSRNLEHTLRQLYGLTPCEVRFAMAFAEEGDLKRVCEQLSIQVSTGRTHLQKLFLKTGVRTQVALGLLIGRLSIR